MCLSHSFFSLLFHLLFLSPALVRTPAFGIKNNVQQENFCVKLNQEPVYKRAYT